MRSFTLFVLLLASTGALGGPSGLPENWQRVNALAIDPKDPRILYLDMVTENRGGGLFKSTDGGSTWQALPRKAGGPGSNGIEDSPGMVLTLVVSPLKPGTLFAGTFSGLFKSTNRGLEWAAMEVGKVDQARRDSRPLAVSVLLFDPKNSTTLYAGTEEGVFRSTDEGLHWTPLPAGPVVTEFGMDAAELEVSALVADPTRSGTLYAVGQAGIYKTVDDGSSWHLIDKGLRVEEFSPGVEALAVDPQSPQVLLASTGEGLFRSADGGESWSLREDGIESEVRLLAFEPGNSAMVYAGTGGALLRSDNGGESWMRLLVEGVTTLVFDPRDPATIYAGTDTGLFKSTNRGESWISAGRGLAGTP